MLTPPGVFPLKLVKIPGVTAPGNAPWYREAPSRFALKRGGSLNPGKAFFRGKTRRNFLGPPIFQQVA